MSAPDIMTSMSPVAASQIPVAAILDRPSNGMLTTAIVFCIIGWLCHVYFYWAKRPDLLEPVGTKRPDPLDDGRIEPPAVVALLTNSYDVPRSAVTATALDLAARGWIRLTTADGELIVVTRGVRPIG